MPKWLRKSLVTLVTVLTLGTVVPSFNVHADTKPSRQGVEDRKENSNNNLGPATPTEVVVEVPADATPKTWPQIAATCESKEDLIARLSEFTQEEAVAQGEEKFGTVIGKTIKDDYQKQVVPKFCDIMEKLGHEADPELIENIDVSHNPAAGTGERIMHFYDVRDGKEVIKFHVRRDHPPLDGYWFNFHYHTYEDGFQGHHELDKIYWDKNTPPKWMVQ